MTLTGKRNGIARLEPRHLCPCPTKRVCQRNAITRLQPRHPLRFLSKRLSVDTFLAMRTNCCPLDAYVTAPTRYRCPARKATSASAGQSVCPCVAHQELACCCPEHGWNPVYLGELSTHKDGLRQRRDVLVPLGLLRLPHAPGHASKLRVVEVERGLVKVCGICVCVVARPSLHHARVARGSAHPTHFSAGLLPLPCRVLGSTVGHTQRKATRSATPTMPTHRAPELAKRRCIACQKPR